MKRITMRYPEGRKKALTLSYDDGVQTDVTLIKYMREYGIKGTFNINTGLFAAEGTVFAEGQYSRRMSRTEILEAYKGDDVEVAVHALKHPHLEDLPEQTALYEVLEDRKNIEELFGEPCHGMAYPFGTYSDKVVEVLKNAGIYYSRTTKSNMDFRQPTDWLRLGATCHHCCAELNQLADKFIEEQPQGNPFLFYLWGHTYEFERDNNWEIIPMFFEKVAAKEDVWYATNIELYNYTKAFEQLDFTLDCSAVYNPSAITVWVNDGRNTVEAPAGKLTVL